ncbi:MAG: hypothetical protein DI630_18660 [Gordonia sp. (in: high G+C Gram-positive bacteria)]|nr:MAG: hypothetical protein DI630_18660 [Gordonia sp. (in: high G+C Gram-positive bacteria)]
MESVCVKAAARRDPCALNPMLPGRRWASWAPGLTERERWDCLAEIADRWSDSSDRDTGLRPGRWDEPTCHSGVYGEFPLATRSAPFIAVNEKRHLCLLLLSTLTRSPPTSPSSYHQLLTGDTSGLTDTDWWIMQWAGYLDAD